MKFYEIKNIKTQESAQTTAKNFAEACKSNNWRPQDCRCVWKADPEDAGNPANYWAEETRLYFFITKRPGAELAI